MDIRRDDQNSKRGYLTGDFEFFHLKDKKSLHFESHYHDFNKITIFISGAVTYYVEGRAYQPKPWDILLKSSREEHTLEVEGGETYERIVIWVNPSFLEKHSSSECSLTACFELASGKNRNLLRLSSDKLKNIRQVLLQLEEAKKGGEFGSRVLGNSLFIQLIVYLNRLYLGYNEGFRLDDGEYDENIDGILKYINGNIKGDLSIDRLSSEFYMSKYYLMHRFKKQTGYSIHSYILQKRLIMASELLKKGMPATEASIECGFGDYSSFVRAFKKNFGLSPKNYLKSLRQAQAEYALGKHFID